MASKLFVLAHQEARKRCIEFINSSPDNYEVRISEPKKRRIQEEKYHAMIGEIAKQWKFLDKLWSAESMKRLLVDQFIDAMREVGEPIDQQSEISVSIDGKRFVQLGIQTSLFSVKEATNFIEWLYAFGAEANVIFKE